MFIDYFNDANGLIVQHHWYYENCLSHIHRHGRPQTLLLDLQMHLPVAPPRFGLLRKQPGPCVYLIYVLDDMVVVCLMHNMCSSRIQFLVNVEGSERDKPPGRGCSRPSQTMDDLMML